MVWAHSLSSPRHLVRSKLPNQRLFGGVQVRKCCNNYGPIWKINVQFAHPAEFRTFWTVFHKSALRLSVHSDTTVLTRTRPIIAVPQWRPPPRREISLKASQFEALPTWFMKILGTSDGSQEPMEQCARGIPLIYPSTKTPVLCQPGVRGCPAGWEILRNNFFCKKLFQLFLPTGYRKCSFHLLLIETER